MPSLIENPVLSLDRLPDMRRAPEPLAPCDGAMRCATKRAIASAYKGLGLMRLHEAIRARRSAPHMTALLLHRVTDQIAPDGLTVGTQWFRDFCRLMKSDYRVVHLDEIARHLRTGEVPPRRTVAITFDDCYADNFEAARVLHEHGLPATFFVPTGFVGTSLRFAWDDHLPAMPNLTWEQIEQMVAWGHEIGSHSVSHPEFSKLNAEQSLRELVESRQTLEERLQRPVKWFAFPFGAQTNFRPEHCELVRKAGYDGCFSAIRGAIELNMAGQILPREAVPYFRNLTQLELHINRCLDWMYRLKRKFRPSAAS